MSNNIIKIHSGNHTKDSEQPAGATGHDDRLATLVDYLLEEPFREQLDFIIFAQSEQMAFHHNDFEEFSMEHLMRGDWDDQRRSLMDLADQMIGNGQEMLRIVNDSPASAIPVRLAKAHAAATANANAAMKAATFKVDREIADFWAAEEERDGAGSSKDDALPG